jgi:hypothetical protein
MYYQKGDCSAAPSNADGVTYVPGDIDPKSAVYHEDTGTLNVNYTPYGDQRGAIANIFVGTPSHTAPTEFEKFASRIAVGADNVNAFALQAGLQAGAAALGGVAQLGLEALAARNASPAVRVVINWAHRIQDIRPGHIPPPGTQEEIQAAVEAAVKAKRYTTDANGVINGTTIIRGIEVGFRGKQIGLVVRVSSVFGIR